jgi:hypothetical protein
MPLICAGAGTGANARIRVRKRMNVRACELNFMAFSRVGAFGDGVQPPHSADF